MTSLPSCSAFVILAQVRKPATSFGEGQTASCACPFPATSPNIEAAPTRLRILHLIASSHRQRCLSFCMRESRVDVNLPEGESLRLLRLVWNYSEVEEVQKFTTNGDAGLFCGPKAAQLFGYS